MKPIIHVHGANTTNINVRSSQTHRATDKVKVTYSLVPPPLETSGDVSG